MKRCRERIQRLASGTLVVALLLALCAPALADVPSLGSKMIKYAKSALTSLASGDYDKVVTGLPFSGISPSADEWRSFAEGSFSDLSGSSPQSKYAVAYWTGHLWRVAVPVSKPSSGKVETLVLSSEDGSSFTGYACLSWSDVQSEYQSSDYVKWDEEYSGANSAKVANDVK